MPYHVHLICDSDLCCLCCFFKNKLRVKNYCWIIKWINYFRGLLLSAVLFLRFQTVLMASIWSQPNFHSSDNSSALGLYCTTQDKRPQKYKLNCTLHNPNAIYLIYVSLFFKEHVFQLLDGVLWIGHFVAYCPFIHVNLKIITALKNKIWRCLMR